MHVHALSLVDRGANKRRFRIYKAAKPSCRPDTRDDDKKENAVPVLPPREQKLDPTQRASGSHADLFQHELSAIAREPNPAHRHTLPTKATRRFIAATESLLAPDTLSDTGADEDDQGASDRQQGLTEQQRPSVPAKDTSRQTPEGGHQGRAPLSPEHSMKDQTPAGGEAAALHTALEHALERQDARLNRMTEQLIELQCGLTRLSKAAGLSNGEHAQARAEARAATRHRNDARGWDAVTDGFGYLNTDALTRRKNDDEEL
ncbi:MAG: hypothetical protein AAF471_02080 [Myxococcota bacterium]